MRTMILLAALSGCDNLTLIEYTGCPIDEMAGDCENGPVCVSVDDAQTAAFAYAWQCGGSGSAADPGDADDCIQAEVYAFGDPNGDQLCAVCSDVDDSGPSHANPWTYLLLGVYDCNDSAAY